MKITIGYESMFANTHEVALAIFVADANGSLREGEIEWAKQWAAQLVRATVSPSG